MTQKYDWASQIIDEFCKNCEVLGVKTGPDKIFIEMHGLQHFSCDFDFDYSYKKGSCVQIRELTWNCEWYRIADELRENQQKMFYKVHGKKRSGRIELFDDFGQEFDKIYKKGRDFDKSSAGEFYAGWPGFIENVLNDLHKFLAIQLQRQLID